MAEKTFTFREGWIDAIKALPDDVRLELYDAIVGIAFGDKIEGLKPMVGVALNFIKRDIEEEFRHKEAIAERNRRNGAKHVSKQNPVEPSGTQENPKNPVGYLASQQERKEAKERSISKINSNEFTLFNTPTHEEAITTPKPKKSDKDPEKVRLNSEARKVFTDIYRQYFESEYVWSGADAGAMTRLLSSIRVSRESRSNPLPIDTDSMIEALREFLLSINKDWIMMNFSVKKISSQYNEIISEIKHRRQNDGANKQRERRSGTPAPQHSDEDYRQGF